MSKKSSWDGKSRGGLYGYKIFNFILSTFGLGFAYFILYFVAFYFLFFGGRSTKASFDYFKNIQGQGTLTAIKNIYKCYYNFGQTILDKVAVQSKKNHPFTSNSTGVDILYDFVERKQGAILISAHLGNWEIAGHFLHKLKIPINIVVFDGEHQRIKEMLKDVMKEKKLKIIPIKEDFSHIIEIHKALKNKEFICIHGDRFTDAEVSKKITFDFMGRPADFPIGPFRLVSRLKVPYCFVFAIKSSSYNYNFFAFENESESYSLEDIMEAYVKQLEVMVKKYPKQWYNFYPFWKIRKEIA